jgi:hypothetical protein
MLRTAACQDDADENDGFMTARSTQSEQDRLPAARAVWSSNTVQPCSLSLSLSLFSSLSHELRRCIPDCKFSSGQGLLLD